MALGLLGKKLGMTHVYDDYGRRLPATAIQAGPCTIVGIREMKQHGYEAIQLAFEPMDAKRTTKPRVGQFKKAGTAPFRHIREFRLSKRLTTGQAKKADAAPAESEWKLGQQLTIEVFKQYELVDVTGTSIGKGFQGGVKRWGWKGGPQTHGSMSHRSPGSIGSTTTPGRVWKGHHLPGHMGQERSTTQNARILLLDPENNLLVVQGAVPGAENGLVMIRKSQKRPGVIKTPQAFAVVIEDYENLSKTAKAASKKLKTPSPAAK